MKQNFKSFFLVFFSRMQYNRGDMRKRILKFTGVLLAAALLITFTACGNAKLYAFTSYAHFNYIAAQWAYQKQSDEKDSATWQQIGEALTRIENSVSASEEGSSISRFNKADAGAEVEIDETAYNLLVLAKELYVKTDGAYNPAVGNLIDLWGFSTRNYAEVVYPYDRENPQAELPDEEYIQAFLSLSDFSKVELSEREGKFYALKPDCTAILEGDGNVYTMQLNLGGIGKGYAVDEAEKIIRAAGYEYGYFNLGGSSMSVLQNPKNKKQNYAWEIGVVNPRVGSLYAGGDFMSVTETNICLSSSGDYNQYYTFEGKRYSHIINPKTGYPVNAAKGEEGGIICASVFGLSAAEGDATTTALIVMGKDKAVNYIKENLSEVHACFVYDNGNGTYTLYTNMEESNYKLYEEMEIEKI